MLKSESKVLIRKFISLRQNLSIHTGTLSFVTNRNTICKFFTYEEKCRFIISLELITFTESECSQKILNFQKIDKDSLKNRKIRNNNKIYMIEIVKFYKNMLKTAPNKKPHQITDSACFR